MNPLISEGKSILAARATAHRQLCKTGQPRALRQRSGRAHAGSQPRHSPSRWVSVGQPRLGHRSQPH
jgi:hypothetical protein